METFEQFVPELLRNKKEKRGFVFFSHFQ